MHSFSTGLKKAFGRTSVLAAAALLALGAASASANQAVPFPTRNMPAVVDHGAATDASITVTVALRHRDEAGLEKLAAALYTPGQPSFRKFLSAAEFHQRFDPAAETVSAASAYFRQFGMTVRHDGHLLEVTGSAAQHQAAFGVALHHYELPAHGKAGAVHFHAAVGQPTIAHPGVAASVVSVLGLDNHPAFAPNSVNRTALTAKARPAAVKALATTGAAGTAYHDIGAWTVTDVASWYNVNPLYAAGIHGEHQTIGIVTLASFTPSDAFTYWAENGLTTNPNRIHVVDIDGGPGPICDACGSGETTLDVEQSGGLAPAAAMVVYQAPNTNHSFLHAFAKAVNDNKADSISVSWGSFEWFDTLGREKSQPGNPTYLKAFNQVFLQAAVQGQTVIAAQGDAGAYEANRAAPVWAGYDPVLSVGAPASSPWITSAGGTTLPVTMTFSTGDVVTIPTEQAWGWGYLTDVCAHLGYDPVSCGIFPVGTGGGVSSYFRVPDYQKSIKGVRVTEAGQSLTDQSTSPPTTYVTLPAGFRGRNVPDVSLNADPETGYLVAYTSESGTFGESGGSGGTSFVAPQLNGIAALLIQNNGGRIGLLNLPLYDMVRTWQYKGATAPLRDIAAGDNWFYTGAKGYDNASGVGAIDVTNFANALSGTGVSAKSRK